MILGTALTRIVASLFSTVVGALTDRVMSHADVLPGNRDAVRDAIATELQRLFGGEHLRMYVPRLSAEQRRERDASIGATASAPAETVAQRERISERWVRKVRGRIGGHREF